MCVMSNSTQEEKEKKSQRLNLSINKKMYQLCERAVGQGLADTVPEFIRQCVSIRLEKLYSEQFSISDLVEKWFLQIEEKVDNLKKELSN